MFKKFRKDIIDGQYVLSNLINQEMTVKYKRSVLGFFWSLVNPLAMMSISAIVFGSIMRFDLKDFVVFLFAAMLPWNFFSLAVDTCGVSLLNAEGFIKKIYIPKVIFPMASLCAQFLNMFFSMLALFIIMLFLGARVTVALTFLPIAFAILFLFTTGVGLIMATLTVYFRDMRYIMGIVLNAGYYLTPTLYPLEYIPGNLKLVIYLNPMYYITDLFRASIYRAEFPAFQTTGIAFAIALVTFICGLVVFYKYESDFVFRM